MAVAGEVLAGGFETAQGSRTSDAATRALRVFAAALFVVLALVSLLMTGPLVHGDEGSYLLNGAAIAGKLSSGLGSGYYSGYSLLIAPGYWLFGDFGSIYHYVLLVNAALLASLPFALRRILQQIAPEAGPAWHALGAIAASGQLAVLTIAPLALSENLLVPLYAWAFAFAGALLARRRAVDAAACGALAGALFLVHPRGALMAAALLGAVSLPVLRDRGLRRPLVWLWLCAAAVAALHGPLEALAKKPPDAQVDTYSLSVLLARYGTAAAWKQALVNAFGASAYLVIASVGLLVPAVRAAFARLPEAWRPPSRQGASATLLLGLLLGLAASIAVTAFYLNPPQRADQVVYGRYTLPAAIPLLAYGLVQLRSARRGRPPAAWWGAAAMLGCVVAMGLLFRFVPHPPADRWVHVNILDFYIPFVLVGRIDWPTIGIYFCTIAFAMYSAVFLLSARAAVVVFIAYNLAAAVYITVDSTLPSNALRARERQVDGAVREFEQVTGRPLCVALARTLDHWHTVNYRNWLFDRIDESTVVDRGRCVRAVIASLTQRRPDADAYRLVATDLYRPRGLFVARSDALDAYAAAHALPAADFPSPIPEDDRASRITLSGIGDPARLRSGATLTFRVRVAQVSAGPAWPAIFDASPLLAVRAGARVDPVGAGDPHVEYRAELPRSLRPGEETSTDLTIGPFRQPGRYTVEVGALQENVAWFTGTQTFTLDVIP